MACDSSSLSTVKGLGWYTSPSRVAAFVLLSLIPSSASCFFADRNAAAAASASRTHTMTSTIRLPLDTCPRRPEPLPPALPGVLPGLPLLPPAAAAARRSAATRCRRRRPLVVVPLALPLAPSAALPALTSSEDRLEVRLSKLLLLVELALKLALLFSAAGVDFERSSKPLSRMCFTTSTTLRRDSCCALSGWVPKGRMRGWVLATES